MLFPELPVGAKKALIYYHSMDCSDPDFYDLTSTLTSPCPNDMDWESLISHADQIWAQHSYPLKYLSLNEAKDYVMQHSPDLVDSYEDFDSYHACYVDDDLPEHPEPNWPVLAMPSVGEALLDGWHRLHSYVRAKHERIPFLFLDGDN